MCEKNKKNEFKHEKNTMGWLKLFIIGSKSNPCSRTVYVYKESMIYAVLHTDTTGATKAISLPATENSGSEYICKLDNGDKSKIKVYPHVVNIHYIDKFAEEI